MPEPLPQAPCAVDRASGPDGEPHIARRFALILSLATACGLSLTLISSVAAVSLARPLSWNSTTGTTWPEAVPTRWAPCSTYAWATSLGASHGYWQALGITENADGTRSQSLFQIYRVSAGYPFPCSTHEQWAEYSIYPASSIPPRYVFDEHPQRTLLDRGITIERTSNSGSRVIVIPTRPIWLGLTLNTTIYTGLILVARALFFEVRTSRHRRRGVCTNCGYPLPQCSTKCPECGASPPRHAKTNTEAPENSTEPPCHYP